MKFFFAAVSVLIITASCNNVQVKINKPLPPPASADAVKTALKGQTYTVENVGFVHTFMDQQEPVRWSEEMKDTSSFYRDFLAERKGLRLQFVNDTLVKESEAGKAHEGTWNVEKDTGNVVLLNVKYADESFSFGSEPTLVTYTYRIKGMEDGRFYAESPREMNRDRVVLMMKKN